MGSPKLVKSKPRGMISLSERALEAVEKLERGEVANRAELAALYDVTPKVVDKWVRDRQQQIADQRFLRAL